MIASLWSVDDNATVELMKAFYTPVASSAMPYGAALTLAKRTLAASQKWRHPFYWAPFILVGNPSHAGG
jgi:CHAT domain-containing protein